jgi:hypothetical protein
MNLQPIFVERRERPRVGVFAELENITYGVLRKHGIASESFATTSAAEPIKQ